MCSWCPTRTWTPNRSLPASAAGWHLHPQPSMDLLLSAIARENSYSQRNSCIFRLLPQLRNFSDNKEDINSVVQRAPGCEKVGQKQQACFLQFLETFQWKGRWSTGVYNASHKLTPRPGPEILPMSVHHTGAAFQCWGCPAWIFGQGFSWGLLPGVEARHLPWRECLCTSLFHGLLLVLGLHLCHPNSPARHTWRSKKN